MLDCLLTIAYTPFIEILAGAELKQATRTIAYPEFVTLDTGHSMAYVKRESTLKPFATIRELIHTTVMSEVQVAEPSDFIIFREVD